MNIIKSRDYFNPLDITQRCHIIGCGSVGSTVAENLARLGITKFALYDFDIVEPHNIANQMFVDADIKRSKVDATMDIIVAINPDAKRDIKLYPKGYEQDTKLSGYVFLCVDNIELRKSIAQSNMLNRNIKAMFDFRTRLEDAQHYAADWNNASMVKNFIKSMDFTHDEAHAATPVTACNIEMGIAPTVRVICSLGVSNFMNYVRCGSLKKIIVANPFTFDIEAY